MVEFDKRTSHYRLGSEGLSPGQRRRQEHGVGQAGRSPAGGHGRRDQRDGLPRRCRTATKPSACAASTAATRSACSIWSPASAAPSTAARRSACCLPICPTTAGKRWWRATCARMTQYSLVSRDELERDRREIRERGYSVSWEDVTLHACALGAPVRDASGSVVAAVSISGHRPALLGRAAARTHPQRHEAGRRPVAPAGLPAAEWGVAHACAVAAGQRAHSAALSPRVCRLLEQIADLAEEAGRRAAVEDAVVGGQARAPAGAVSPPGPAGTRASARWRPPRGWPPAAVR